MFVAFNVTAEPGSTDEDPYTIAKTLPVGTITHIAVQFPAGCVGLVHVKILQASRVIWPRDESEDLRSDAYVIQWDEDHPILQGDTQYVLSIANTDDTYPHTISFWFTIAPPAHPAASSPDGGLLDRLRHLRP